MWYCPKDMQDYTKNIVNNTGICTYIIHTHNSNESVKNFVREREYFKENINIRTHKQNN